MHGEMNTNLCEALSDEINKCIGTFSNKISNSIEFKFKVFEEIMN